jgi:transposase-like protein
VGFLHIPPCGLFGHRVRRVATRDGFDEYACHCGHSFLKEDKPSAFAPGASAFASATADKSADKKGLSLQKIRHPAVCVVSGHYIHFLAKRAGFSEYVCQNCGHPFCFADGA